MQPSKEKARRLLSTKTILFCGVSLILYGIFHLTTVDIGRVTYFFDGKEAQETTLPFLVPTEGSRLQVQFLLETKAIIPQYFRIKPDDCLREITINGQSAIEPEFFFCDYNDGRVLPVGKYLQPGTNTVDIYISDDGGKGGLRFHPSSQDPLRFGVTIAFILLLIWYVITLLHYFFAASKYYSLYLCFFLGALLRIIYTAATPHNFRAHDADAHLDYIIYVAQYAAIPPASQGWEYHQAPIYYFVSALWWKVGTIFEWKSELVLLHLQVLSVVLAIATLAIALWIGKQSLEQSRHKTLLPVYSAILVSFPAFVYFSSRVSNDALFQLTAFASLALYIAWWQNPTSKRWYIFLMSIALGSAVKATGYIFFPAAFLGLLLHKGYSIRKKAETVSLSLILLFVLSAWLPLYRITVEANNSNYTKLGNTTMSGQLAVQNTPRHQLTFNPIKILEHPFNDSWNDSQRRQYFWEYFYKSAFFGEFTFAEHMRKFAVIIHLVGLMILPIAIYGALLCVIKRFYKDFPLHICFAGSMSAAILYQYKFAYAPNQDFRFSILLVPILAYYLVRGIHYLPKVFQKTAAYLVIVQCLLCGVFLLIIFTG